MTSPLCAAREALERGATSSVELTRACLARIEATDERINAWLHVDAEGALAQAAAVDARRARGERLGPLAGVPVGLKDIFLTRDLPTTCGSRILEGYRPPYDATVVARLRAAGAVLLGKQNMDAFAMGSSNENSAFGAVHNPWDVDRTPGGSSGGSAAAVAAGHCFGALGTDTGGSIRQPASFCGVVGLKPTYGRVSRFGVIAFASSLDQPGPLARTVRDAAALFEACAGPDPHDATSVDVPLPVGLEAMPRDADLAGVRLGVPAEYFGEGLAPGVAAATQAALDRLRALGADLVEVHLPHARYGVAAYYLVATAEASSNLARFDGVRYGLRRPGADLAAMYGATRDAGFGLEVKRRIMLGTYALSAGYYDAYYRKASQARTLVRRDFDAALDTVDAIVTPVSPTTAFRLGERVDDPLAMYLADVFTIGCNLAGLPGLSVPCGFDEDHLPVGLQLIGRAFDEATLLRIAASYEDATGWCAERPALCEEAP
jgi:aspartyl-tRNA(Asn)/glutamyl-tRNA(Gln) amidotransferase subunit A